MTFVPGQVRGLMDYLLEEQYKEQTVDNSHSILTDEMLFALIADIVLAGNIHMYSSESLNHVTQSIAGMINGSRSSTNYHHHHSVSLMLRHL